MSDNEIHLTDEQAVCPTDDCAGRVEHDPTPEDTWDGEDRTPGECLTCGLEVYVVTKPDGAFVRIEPINPLC